jgi:flagella basal body P-ring formation protein FlgA
MKVRPRASLTLALAAAFLQGWVAWANPAPPAARGRQGVAPRARIVVRSEATAQADVLLLGDVAEIVCPDEEARARLASISLGYAPRVGAARELTREQIERAVAAAGFHAGQVVIEIGRAPVVRRASQRVAADVLREAVERAALSALRAAGAEARLVRFDAPQSVSLPSGALAVGVEPLAARDLFRPFTAYVTLSVDGRLARRLAVTTEAEAEAEVCVAARDLAAGARVRPEDVKVERRRLTRAPSDYCARPGELRGVSARRGFAAGETVGRADLAREIVIKPGDAVRIVGESGATRVSVAGEARGAGRVGDRVQVRNKQSGAALQAVVVDEGLVRVAF